MAKVKKQTITDFFKVVEKSTSKNLPLLLKECVGAIKQENIGEISNIATLLLTVKPKEIPKKILVFLKNIVEELNLDSKKSAFINDIARNLVKFTKSTNKKTRLSAIFLIAFLKSDLNIDSFIVDLSERLFDIDRSVRKEAVLLLKEKQNLFVKDGIKVLHLFKDLLKHDNCAEVRKLVLNSILKNDSTFKAICERCHDTDFSVRKSFFNEVLWKLDFVNLPKPCFYYLIDVVFRNREFDVKYKFVEKIYLEFELKSKFFGFIREIKILQFKDFLSVLFEKFETPFSNGKMIFQQDEFEYKLGASKNIKKTNTKNFLDSQDFVQKRKVKFIKINKNKRLKTKNLDQLEIEKEKDVLKIKRMALFLEIKTKNDKKQKISNESSDNILGLIDNLYDQEKGAIANMSLLKENTNNKFSGVENIENEKKIPCLPLIQYKIDNNNCIDSWYYYLVYKENLNGRDSLELPEFQEYVAFIYDYFSSFIKLKSIRDMSLKNNIKSKNTEKSIHNEYNDNVIAKNPTINDEEINAILEKDLVFNEENWVVNEINDLKQSISIYNTKINDETIKNKNITEEDTIRSFCNISEQEQNSILDDDNTDYITSLLKILQFYDIFTDDYKKTLQNLLYKLLTTHTNEKLIEASFITLKKLPNDINLIGSIVKKNIQFIPEQIHFICKCIMQYIYPIQEIHKIIVNEIILNDKNNKYYYETLLHYVTKTDDININNLIIECNNIEILTDVIISKDIFGIKDKLEYLLIEQIEKSNMKVIPAICKLLLSQKIHGDIYLRFILLNYYKNIDNYTNQFLTVFLHEYFNKDTSLLVSNFTFILQELHDKKKFIRQSLFWIQNSSNKNDLSNLYYQICIEIYKISDQNKINLLWEVISSIEINDFNIICVKKIKYVLNQMKNKFENSDSVEDLITKFDNIDDGEEMQEEFIIYIRDDLGIERF
ncbi:hypothetical protein EDEG_03736 [Edhazardia aedis USNM 41457]|uniref:Uncharacterized protein n=1 Tax=Edhazardia aedis (strain USNM 41457) TaxID=1003232 RepID=J9DK52_EDHAE|nr:hypothetical protein EDEG_03736 [Edhazardia aedis USNM 41457]|eukprot:EJW01742.1 hypothetical protein EDEG_03736 [Edhazardia aedis USNM 41457]